MKYNTPTKEQVMEKLIMFLPESDNEASMEINKEILNRVNKEYDVLFKSFENNVATRLYLRPTPLHYETMGERVTTNIVHTGHVLWNAFVSIAEKDEAGLVKMLSTFMSIWFRAKIKDEITESIKKELQADNSPMADDEDFIKFMVDVNSEVSARFYAACTLSLLEQTIEFPVQPDYKNDIYRVEIFEKALNWAAKKSDSRAESKNESSFAKIFFFFKILESSDALFSFVHMTEGYYHNLKSNGSTIGIELMDI